MSQNGLDPNSSEPVRPPLRAAAFLEESGIIGSVGSVGDALDNSAAESFNATLQTELLDRRRVWHTRRQLKSALFEFIEVLLQPPEAALGARRPTVFPATGTGEDNRFPLPDS